MLGCVRHDSNGELSGECLKFKAPGRSKMVALVMKTVADSRKRFCAYFGWIQCLIPSAK